MLPGRLVRGVGIPGEAKGERDWSLRARWAGAEERELPLCLWTRLKTGWQLLMDLSREGSESVLTGKYNVLGGFSSSWWFSFLKRIVQRTVINRENVLTHVTLH